MTEPDNLSVHDVTLEQALRVQLAAAGVDASNIVIEIRDARAVLTGSINSASEHGAIAEALVKIDGIEQVVDALHVRGESTSVQSYFKGGTSVNRAVEQAFDPDVTWEEYWAAKGRTKPT